MQVATVTCDEALRAVYGVQHPEEPRVAAAAHAVFFACTEQLDVLVALAPVGSSAIGSACITHGVRQDAPKMAWSGTRSASSRLMAASASRSALVTGLSSALLSMMSFDLQGARPRILSARRMQQNGGWKRANMLIFVTRQANGFATGRIVLQLNYAGHRSRVTPEVAGRDARGSLGKLVCKRHKLAVVRLHFTLLGVARHDGRTVGLSGRRCRQVSPIINLAW
jgi:hypothetical protein